MLVDYSGRQIRLTDERLNHILDHSELRGMETSLQETVARPRIVVQSLSDEEARLYYRFYVGTRVGDKFLCVVVKVQADDAFVLTAYLTDTPKRGEVIWRDES
jgi:hypothetical protein